MACLIKLTPRYFSFVAAAVVATFLAATFASISEGRAADWPTKPVRIVVPYGAGGAGDVVARVIAESLSEQLGQQFIIENRTGGAGIVGSQAVARAEPDGYTLIASGMSSHVLTPAMNRNPGFDPMRDFTHIAFIGGAPSVIGAHSSLGVNSFAELLAMARANPEGLEYVSPGTGTVGNVLAEVVGLKANIKLVHVPYKSGNAAIIDLLAGRVKLGSLNWSTARQHIGTGNLVPLTVSSAHRIAAAPDLPTLTDLGFPDLVTTTWWALSGPPGLPQDIVEKLNRATVKAIDSPAMRKQIEPNAIETKAMSPAEVTRFFQGEIDKWVPLVRAVIKSE